LTLFPGLGPLYSALGSGLSTLNGYARGAKTAVGLLGTLLTAKQAQLAALVTRLNAAAALFGKGLSGAGVYALHVSGTGGNAMLQNALRTATGAPGPELSLCCATVWVSAPAALDPIATLLGI
jgi:hypothetical protein